MVSLDDGINTKISKDSVIYIKGGKIIVNAGIDNHEGDGIDGNGYILIDGGEIISSSNPRSDSGLDSNNGILIDGGRVYAIGSSMDMAEKESKQSTMNLIFNSAILPNNTISIKEKSGKEIFSFNTEKAEFIKGTQRKEYSAAIVSDPSFKSGNICHIYLDGIQLGYTSNEKGGRFRPGPPPNDMRLKNLRKLEEKKMKIDFVLGEGACYYSGIQKYVESVNNGRYLKLYLFSILVLFYLI